MGKKPLLPLALLLLPLLVLAFLPGSSARISATEIPPNEIDAGAGAAADHILVKFKPDADPSEVGRLHAAANAAFISDIAGVGVTRLLVPPGQAQASAALFASSPAVEFAEVDGLIHTQLSPNDPYFTSAYPSTNFGGIAQWAPQSVSAPAAWDITLGDPSIVIAVVDTGVDTQHPDLAAKIVGGTSFVGNVRDGHGHGTHVAGIAAASTNNSTGIAGICQLCSIMPVRVLDSGGSGLMSDVAAGIIFAADNGARVINLSLGGPSTSQTMRAAIDYAFAHDALPVAAMGNGYAPDALEPAYWYHALSVGAVDQSGAKADFSNYGPRTDVVAPGVGVLSTMPTYSTSLTDQLQQNYDALSGTSMATPVVSGIAGLILSRNPSLTAAQVKGIIEATAGDGKSFDPTTGFGLVNAARAVAAAAQSDVNPPSVNVVSPSPGATVSKLFTLGAAPSDDTGVHHVDFIIGGTQAGSPGTAGGGGGGKRGGSTGAWSTQWESTRYWNGTQTVTGVAVDAFGNSANQEMTFGIENAYATLTWNAHLCNPPKGNCPYYILDSVTPQTSAVAHIQVNWTYTSLDNYSNASFWATISDGSTQKVLLTRGSSIDWYPDVTLCACSVNFVGAGMAGWFKRNGAAEADVTLTLTYPR